MADTSSLEKDADGTIVTRPVLGWTTAPVSEIAVILQIQYANTPEDIESGGRLFQIVLTPQQCLHLSDELTKQARRILDQSSPPQRN